MPLITFKDMMLAEVIPDENDLLSHELNKPLNELTTAQRIRRSRNARRNKPRLKLGRRRSSRRIASTRVLKKRAMASARRAMIRRFLKGKSKSALSPSMKTQIEKRLKARRGLIVSMSRRMMPVVRNRDRARIRRK